MTQTHGTGETKCCTLCRVAKPVSEFSKRKHSKDGRHPWCNPCNRAKVKAWRDRFPERAKATHERWVKRNKKRIRKRQRLWRQSLTPEKREYLNRKSVLAHYGVTPEWYERKLAEQHGGCAICSAKLNGGKRNHRLYVDHDHRTDEPRGILCNRCNVRLAALEDSEWLRLGHEYLNRYREAGATSVGQ